MNIVDKRLWQAQNLDDFLFRLRLRDEDILRNSMRHTEFVFSYEAVISPDFVVPDPSKVWGVDISHWNGIVDLSLAKAKGCKFVIIKGCDGSVPTKNFEQNKANAKQNGLPWGVYDWLYRDANVNTTTQTNAWWNQVKNDYPPIGVFIDFEWTTYAGIQSDPAQSDLKLAEGKFRTLSGRKAGVYSAKGYTDQYLKTDLLYWDTLDWWIASYGSPFPVMPNGITRWKFWQFTSFLDGLSLGINTKEGDGNYYNGTIEQFNVEYPAQEIPPSTGDKMYYVARGSINIRQSGVSDAPQVTTGEKYVLTGDIVETEAPVNGFVKLLKLYRNNVRKVLANPAYCGTAWLTLTTYTPPSSSSISPSASASSSVSLSPSASPSPSASQGDIDFVTVHYKDGSSEDFYPKP